MKLKLFALSLLVCLCAFAQPRVSMTSTFTPAGTPATLLVSSAGGGNAPAAFQVSIPVPTGTTIAPGAALTGTDKALYWNIANGTAILLVAGGVSQVADGVFAVVTFPSANYIDFQPSNYLAVGDLAEMLPFSASGFLYVSPCDLNRDGKTDRTDVDLAAAQVTLKFACTTGDLTLDGKCNAADVQRVNKAANGGACVTGK